MKKMIKAMAVYGVVTSSLVACVSGSQAELNGGWVAAQEPSMSTIDLGVLELLNHPTTTLEVLDVDVALDKRAARNLIEHRNGPDGVVDTDDDDLFNTLAEVDSVAWVGQTSLEKLAVWVESQGWLHGAHDSLGVYDGVHFTVAEGRATLDLVNRASRVELVSHIGIGDIASDLILKKRPLRTMAELAILYEVNDSALNLLKAAALMPLTAMCDPAPFLDDETALMQEFPPGMYLVCTGLGVGDSCLDAAPHAATVLVEGEFGPPARTDDCQWEAVKLCAPLVIANDCCTLMQVSQDCQE
jgi:hypothetical protein